MAIRKIPFWTMPFLPAFLQVIPNEKYCSQGTTFQQQKQTDNYLRSIFSPINRHSLIFICVTFFPNWSYCYFLHLCIFSVFFSPRYGQKLATSLVSFPHLLQYIFITSTLIYFSTTDFTARCTFSQLSSTFWTT